MKKQSIFIYAEWLAVFLSLCFTYFLGEEYRWSWWLGGSASLIYIFLVARKKLFAETALHLFYIIMAIMGYRNWGVASEDMLGLRVDGIQHVFVVVSGLVLSVLTGAALKKFSSAKTPLLDATTTVFSILATLMMVAYVRENWLYWIIIDLASIGLYAGRRMWPTAILFLLYSLLALNAYLSWGT